MSTRHALALIVIFCVSSQVGCCTMGGCGGCGMGGQAYDCGPSCGVGDCCGDCTASCGCPEASCCCPEASCCCPEASCCCPDSCGCEVGCGSGVRGGCPLLSRLRRALNRSYCNTCNGCSSNAYWSEWQDSPPCQCDNCDAYGNHMGGPYTNQHGRRARMAKRNMNIGDELRFGEEDVETIYR